MAVASSLSDVSNVITSTDLACVSAYGEEILRVERIALHTQDLARVTLTIIKKYQDRLIFSQWNLETFFTTSQSVIIY